MQRVDVDNAGLVGRVSELQILRDEIDIDQTARNMLQVPELVLPLCPARQSTITSKNPCVDRAVCPLFFRDHFLSFAAAPATQKSRNKSGEF